MDRVFGAVYLALHMVEFSTQTLYQILSVTLFSFILALTAFLLVWLLWLAFTLIFPRQWSQFVDLEHEFLVNRGLCSKALSDHLKRMEKGIVLKTLLLATIILGLMAFVLVIVHDVCGLSV